MDVKMTVKLVPWLVPNNVTVDFMKGVSTCSSTVTMALTEVDTDTLAAQCDRFRADVFKKAGKVDPANRRVVDVGERP